MSRSTALYNLSEQAPSETLVDAARDGLDRLFDYVREGRSWVADEIGRYTDEHLAEQIGHARVIVQYERAHRACVLYIASVGHGSAGVSGARKDHRDARRILAMLVAEADRRVTRYRAGARALAKAMRVSA
jgi:hypothetical protein